MTSPSSALMKYFECLYLRPTRLLTVGNRFTQHPAILAGPESSTLVSDLDMILSQFHPILEVKTYFPEITCRNAPFSIFVPPSHRHSREILTKIMSVFFIFLSLGVIKAHRGLTNFTIFKTINVACIVLWEGSTKF
jgi:hypothetical protein